MPNLAQQLKAEIGRIAKKEIRAETQSYKKAAAAHRAELLALKRRIQALETALKLADGLAYLDPADPPTEGDQQDRIAIAHRADSSWTISTSFARG